MATAASNGGVYVPPFATTAVQTAATTARATATSLSFAAVGTLSGGKTASGTATASTTAAIVDSTGGVDSNSLLAYFTRPYLDAHTLSIPTWRYPYILWFVIAATLIFWSGLYHLSGAGHGGSAFGAIFRKYSIRRLMIGGKAKRTDAEGGKHVVRSKVRWASPTFAQMITVAGMIGVALCLSLIGPDYISPTTCIFGGDCGYQSFYDVKGPPKTTYGSRKRDLPAASWNFLPRDESLNDVDPAPPQSASLGYTIQPKVKRGVNNPNGWAPFNDPLLASSNIDIQANWWTAAARLGLISYAMLPLAVTLALKQWPFNIWATPFLTNYHFDKTAILHRWSGRVIWLFSSGHVAAWLYQLVIDKDPFGRPVLVPVWQWYRFCAGAAAYVLLTIITLFSFKSFRNRYYEFFYWSHVILILLFFAACIVHHAPLMWWPIVAAAWWGAERLVRFIVFLWINGFFKGIGFRAPRDNSRRTSQQSFSVNADEKVEGYGENKQGGARYPPAPYDESAQPLAHGFGQHQYPPSPEVGRPQFGSPAPSYHHSSPIPSYAISRARQLPPPGFASCQLLPGRTVRLVLNTAVPLRWRPGQHVFLSVPAVRLFEAHPYTIVSIDDRAKGVAPIGGPPHSPGSEVVMLIRAQKGFSRALWDTVAKARKEKEDRGASAQECAKGINLRALVSWPIGSSSRVSWDSYDSLLIICGGTGITFGMSVLEYTCRRMARKDGDSKYRTTRVRFVWILREFAHLSWVAPVLRRCYDMIDSSRLQIDLFVSRDAPRPARRTRRQQQSIPTDEFAPPKAPFARQQRSNSSQSLDSEMSELSDAEEDRGTQVSSAYTSTPDYGDHIDSVTDLVLFDGEEDERTAGEVEMSKQVRAAGKIRRALSRKKSGRPAPARPQHQQSHSNFSTFGQEQDVSYSSLSGAAGRRIPGQSTESSPYARADSTFAETGSFADLGFAGVDDHQSEVQSLAGDSSIRGLVSGPGGKRSSGGVEMRTGEYDFLDVTEEDQEDLEVMAELARPGYPKLKEILDEEVGRSVGKTMVACCGPNGLNTTVRHLVSDRIDVSKVLKGDIRSQISLTCEDFSY